jgi:hypothetical protein
METTTDSTNLPIEEKNKGGRPPGSTNKFSKIAREWAEKSGLLPHEILLNLARGKAVQRDVVETDPVTGTVRGRKEWVSPTLEQMVDCAKAAAPYYAPKFGSIEFTKDLTNEQLGELFALFAPGASQEGTGTGDAEAPSGGGEAEVTGSSLPETPATGRRRLKC